jgi:3-hydroxybutyryl-CoA dehydrogenase
MEVEKIIVVGAGFMGSGIAQVAAQAGYDVIMNDVTMEFVEKGMNIISQNLDRQVKKERISVADKDGIMACITGSTDLNDGKDADLVIEAIFENVDAKKDIFQKLDAVCKPGAILASNTSSIPITT